VQRLVRVRVRVRVRARVRVRVRVRARARLQRLREHALVELPLEGGLARLVEVPGRLRPKVDQYE